MRVIKMCGVHPDAEFIVKEISKKLRDGEDWKPFLDEIDGHDLTIKRYKFRPSNSIRKTHSEMKVIIRKLISKTDPEGKRFRGLFIFPDHSRLYISEIALLNLIGSMAGDIFIDETGLVATSWYAPKCWVSAKHKPVKYNLPKINIMMIESNLVKERIMYARKLFGK